MFVSRGNDAQLARPSRRRSSTGAAIWIGVLLVGYQAACACIGPERPPDVTYLGLTATAYHLIGLYGGLALVLTGSAWSRRNTPEHVS